ncbi:MAG: DUF4349 domain-containing protein [Anaerosomatales bacterium]|nr:DUF4349 domain-containing protein [Anaerosomatales bacterium]
MKRDVRRISVAMSAVVLTFALLASTGCSGVRELSDVLGSARTAATDMSRDVALEKGVVDQTYDGYAGGAAPAEDVTDKGVSAPAIAGPLVIKNKTMRIEVKAVQKAVEEIRALATKHGGSITALSVATDDEQPIYRPEAVDYGDGAALRGWVTVRVPVDKFEAFVADVSGIGTVKNQSESAEDVTQQHVDLKARLDNLRAEEKRLREFFAAAKNVNEMLAVERELARVRGEIESLDAQVQYLERQAAMATVTVELTEPKPVIRPQGESWGFLDAITTGFRGAAATIKILIVLALTLLPLVVLGAALYYLVRGLIRRRRARKARAASAPDASAGNVS